MQVDDNTVVFIHYTLTNDEGELLDKSSEDDPLGYLHGHGNIIAGLESALLGRSAGERLDVSVAAEDGYGERLEGLVQDVPLGAFEGIDSVQPGMSFQAETDDGPHPVVVVEVEGDVVTVDGNHPLAGLTLHFQVEIHRVREATSTELEHGHVHPE